MTIKELFDNYSFESLHSLFGDEDDRVVDEDGFTEALKEFTKYHVERALKAAYEKSTILQNGNDVGDFYTWDAYNSSSKDIEYSIDKKSILTAYSLKNII